MKEMRSLSLSPPDLHRNHFFDAYFSWLLCFYNVYRIFFTSHSQALVTLNSLQAND